MTKFAKSNLATKGTYFIIVCMSVIKHMCNHLHIHITGTTVFNTRAHTHTHTHTHTSMHKATMTGRYLKWSFYLMKCVCWASKLTLNNLQFKIQAEIPINPLAFQCFLEWTRIKLQFIKSSNFHTYVQLPVCIYIHVYTTIRMYIRMLKTNVCN